jgi:hypothetical protein
LRKERARVGHPREFMRLKERVTRTPILPH